MESACMFLPASPLHPHNLLWLPLLVPAIFLCNTAESMSTGKELNDSNPISWTPYQPWTALLLKADLSHCMPSEKNNNKQMTKQLAQWLKYQAKARKEDFQPVGRDCHQMEDGIKREDLMHKCLTVYWRSVNFHRSTVTEASCRIRLQSRILCSTHSDDFGVHL